MENKLDIYCTNCNKIIKARLTNGAEIYPHRKDLYKLPFWKCDNCKEFVGTHHKSDDKLRPLGVITNKDIKQLKIQIHNIIDPLWKSGKIKRKHIYANISKELGYTYHTGEIKTLEEAYKILTICKKIAGI